jgi:general stress protein 26
MTQHASASRSVDQLLVIVDEVLGSNRYGFLVSHGPAGHTRLVHHLSAGVGCELWIGTSQRSRKVADLRVSPRVTYAVEDRTRFAYVALYADADVVSDAAVLEARWVPEFLTFFPDGALGGDFVLLRLVPWRIELMSFASAVHPEPYGLLPAALAREDRSGPWHVVPADRTEAVS